MEKIPIGVIIKQIIKENNLSVIDIATKLGVSRQAVYQAFSRDKMNNDERKLWADALKVDISEFDKRSVNQMTSHPNDYLLKYIESLEKRVAEQEKTITVLLGKSGSVSSAGYLTLASFLWAFGLIFGYTTLS